MDADTQEGEAARPWGRDWREAATAPGTPSTAAAPRSDQRQARILLWSLGTRGHGAADLSIWSFSLQNREGALFRCFRAPGLKYFATTPPPRPPTGMQSGGSPETRSAVTSHTPLATLPWPWGPTHGVLFVWLCFLNPNSQHCLQPEPWAHCIHSSNSFLLQEP